MYRNGLIFVDTLSRDNRDSLNFQVGQSIKNVLQNFQFVIIRVGQILKSYQQRCFIFGKRLPRGNRDSANFQVTSSKLPYFCKNFSS